MKDIRHVRMCYLVSEHILPVITSSINTLHQYVAVSDGDSQCTLALVALAEVHSHIAMHSVWRYQIEAI